MARLVARMLTKCAGRWLSRAGPTPKWPWAGGASPSTTSVDRIALFVRRWQYPWAKKYHQRTPVMALGLVNHVRSVSETLPSHLSTQADVCDNLMTLPAAEPEKEIRFWAAYRAAIENIVSPTAYSPPNCSISHFSRLRLGKARICCFAAAISPLDNDA